MHIITKQIFYGDICDNHYIITSKDELEDNMMIFDEVIPETIGQFTGLYDSTQWEKLTKEEQSDWLKNHTADEWKGRKIFEGDIVSNEWCYISGNSVVKFGEYQTSDMSKDYQQGHFGFYLEHIENDLVRKDMMYFANNCVVIGNIHDNPELLEVGEND